MVARYMAGETLAEIGESYGISRERVRQILKKAGITGADGGHVVRVEQRRLAYQARLDASCMQRHGMLRAEYLAAPAKAKNAYRQQKTNARLRGIEWQLKFADWWRIWQVSGKWEQRGRGYGYCMARKGDSGPYSLDNVYITTGAQNASDQYIWKPWHARNRIALACYEHGGLRLTLRQWAARLEVRAETLRARLSRGWSFERAITEPLHDTNTRRLAQQRSVAA